MRSAAAALLLALGSCAAAPSPKLASAPHIGQAPASVQVVKDGQRWVAEYRFQSAAPAWVFSRSALARVGEQPWRPRSWQVLTPGVRLERRGSYDVLVATAGGAVPDRVRIGFEPFAEGLLADYDPALKFTDGTVALFTGHFSVFPRNSVAEVERLPIDLNGLGIETTTEMAFRDRGRPVLYQGRRIALATGVKPDSYGLFGPAKPFANEAIGAIIDPGLPAWIRNSLANGAPQILASYARRLGPAPGGRPTFIVSWAGPTPGLTSMGGSVLPSLVVMRFEGAGVLSESPALRNQARWFIAHEAAHFWLGQAVSYEFSRDAWITEGGADLLAVRTVAALDPSYDARKALQSSVDECIKLTKVKGVASAQQRNEHRAYYACGAVFGLVAESATKRSVFDFTRGLIDANRGDGILSRSEWLAELDRLSSQPGLSADVGRLIDVGASDPKVAIASLFTRAGVRHELAPDGTPRLL